MREVLSQIDKGLISKSAKEIQDLRSLLIPPQVQQSLRRCTTIDDVAALAALYTKHPRLTKTRMARELGLGPVAQAIIDGSGERFCFLSNLATEVPDALKQMSSKELSEAVMLLIGETIAKDPDTFEQLKVLCHQIPPYIRSTRKTLGAKSSSLHTSTSESERTQNNATGKIIEPRNRKCGHL